MWQGESRETELAIQIADRIISIQECDGGYDYSIMDDKYVEIDGGVYDDPEADINYVLLSIVEDLKENPDTNGAKGQISKESKIVPLDFDEVSMNAENANRISPAVYRSRAVMEFKAKTEECFREINGLSPMEIEEQVEEYIRAKIYENDFDAEIVGVVISGSRCRGLEHKKSDLDVVVEYTGSEREDDMFNLFHEDKLRIGGVLVDINPITECKTGTLEEYLPGVEKYLSEKVIRMEKKPSVKVELEKKMRQATVDRKGKHVENPKKDSAIR